MKTDDHLARITDLLVRIEPPAAEHGKAALTKELAALAPLTGPHLAESM